MSVVVYKKDAEKAARIIAMLCGVDMSYVKRRGKSIFYGRPGEPQIEIAPHADEDKVWIYVYNDHCPDSCEIILELERNGIDVLTPHDQCHGEYEPEDPLVWYL